MMSDRSKILVEMAELERQKHEIEGRLEILEYDLDHLEEIEEWNS